MYHKSNFISFKFILRFSSDGYKCLLCTVFANILFVNNLKQMQDKLKDWIAVRNICKQGDLTMNKNFFTVSP